ncbi:MAG: hypothetical protein VW920_03010 [Gammaproteobacteria bacterium]|jgi:hypothetical protein
MSKNIVKTVVLIVIFFVGAYIGSITSLFNDQVELVDLYEGTEDFLRLINPSNCEDENEGLNCVALFDEAPTTWEASSGSCVNSSIKIYFDEPKMIEFITIDESVNNTSSNVKEIQIGSRVFELTGDDSFSEWFDLLEKVESLEFTILSLYENPSTSTDCGIEEITFYGRDYK